MVVFLLYWRVFIYCPNSTYTKAPSNLRVHLRYARLLQVKVESVSAVNDSVLVHQECLGYFSSRSTVPAVHPYYTFPLVILEHKSTL